MASLGSPNSLLFGGAKDYEIERSLRFNKADNARLNRTPSSASHRRIWTFSAWVKLGRTGIDKDGIIFNAGPSGTGNNFALRINNTGAIGVDYYGVGGYSSTGLLRDPSAWYHCVWRIDTTDSTAANRVKVYVNGELFFNTQAGLSQNDSVGGINNNVEHTIGVYSYDQTHDYTFDGYLAEVHFVDGTALDASSFGETHEKTGQWVPKKVKLTSPNDGTTWSSSGADPNSLLNSGTYANVFDADTSNALTVNQHATNYITLCDGVSISCASTFGFLANSGSSTNTLRINGSTTLAQTASGTVWTDGSFTGTITKIEFGYLAGSGSSSNIYGVRVDGVQLVDGFNAYGANGFYLNFSDNSGTTATTLGKDSAGSNNWTPNNFSVAAGVGNDSVTDTPTNNFCTLNPVIGTNARSGATPSNGNLDIVGTDESTNRATFVFGPGHITSGKWYWEITSTGGAYGQRCGITSDLNASQGTNGSFFNQTNVSWFGPRIYKKYTASSSTEPGVSYSSGDVTGVAYNVDDGEIKYYKNGTLSLTDDTIPSAATTELHIVVHASNTGSNGWPVGSLNFGQRAFAHTPPTGFEKLCSANLSTPAIKKPSDHFNTNLYTGTITDSSAQTVPGVGFQPNLTWIKRRDSTNSHQLVDSVRGVGKWLESSGTNAEETNNTHGVLTAFNADGFVLTGGSTNANLCCEDGNTYVSWNWKGGSTVTNDTGSIDSQVNANPSAGFSIVSYTGTGSDATIGHGLGAVPDVIIVKCRSDSANWGVFHKSLGASYIVQLNLSNAQWQNSGVFNDVLPTSTVFSVDGGSGMSGEAKTYIAYCFSSVEGYSKFGSYTGNGDADGTFIYTGFKPMHIIYKKVAAENWHMLDTKRDASNPNSAGIDPNLCNKEASDANLQMDFLSNGFKLRASHGTANASGEPYIYMAFAESPFKYATAR